MKIAAHIDRQIAANPEVVQVENGWRSPKEQRPGAVQRGQFREIDNASENMDAEPVCASAKTAIIVYGKRVGTTITVCTDNHCPVHDPHAAAREAAHPAPTIAPAPKAETEAEAEQRQQEYEQQREAYEKEEQRRDESANKSSNGSRKSTRSNRPAGTNCEKIREATFERIIENAPATFAAAQLRVLLRAIVNLDPYSFPDDLAEKIADENEPRTAEEVLMATIDGLPDEKLTGFALRLALSGHQAIPREGEVDFLTEAENVFALSQPKEKATGKKAKTQPKIVPVDLPKKKPIAKKKSAA